MSDINFGMPLSPKKIGSAYSLKIKDEIYILVGKTEENTEYFANCMDFYKQQKL